MHASPLSGYSEPRERLASLRCRRWHTTRVCLYDIIPPERSLAGVRQGLALRLPWLAADQRLGPSNPQALRGRALPLPPPSTRENGVRRVALDYTDAWESVKGPAGSFLGKNVKRLSRRTRRGNDAGDAQVTWASPEDTRDARGGDDAERHCALKMTASNRTAEIGIHSPAEFGPQCVLAGPKDMGPASFFSSPCTP